MLNDLVALYCPRKSHCCNGKHQFEAKHPPFTCKIPSFLKPFFGWCSSFFFLPQVPVPWVCVHFFPPSCEIMCEKCIEKQSCHNVSKPVFYVTI